MRSTIIPDGYLLRPLFGHSFKAYGKEDFDGILVDNASIARKVQSLAVELGHRYKDQVPRFLWVADGAKRFYQDFKEQYPFAFSESWTRIKSYEGDKSNGRPEFTNFVADDYAGMRVLIFEDVVDTGKTMLDLTTRLKAVGADPIVVTLLDKRLLGKLYLPDVALFTVPERFIVGYGMDYEGLYRDLDDIYVLGEAGKRRVDSLRQEQTLK